jgi:hypothetical protein
MTMVLFCGGHADGRWRDLPHDLKEYSYPAHGRFHWDGPDKVEITRQRYRIWGVQILGWHMRIALPEGENNESSVALRTLLQRDVFDHIITVRRPR